MKHAVRAQVDVDDTQDDVSLATGLDLSDEVKVTRQEFREEADVNTMLRRFGVPVAAAARRPVFGDVDWDLDLHSAHIAVERAGAAFRKLPRVLQEKYKDTRGLLDAMNSGELAEDLKEDRERKEHHAAAAKAASEAAETKGKVEPPAAPPKPPEGKPAP